MFVLVFVGVCCNCGLLSVMLVVVRCCRSFCDC